MTTVMKIENDVNIKIKTKLKFKHVNLLEKLTLAVSLLEKLM